MPRCGSGSSDIPTRKDREAWTDPGACAHRTLTPSIDVSWIVGVRFGWSAIRRGSPAARHPEPPPHEQDDREDDANGDREIEGLESVTDVGPIRAEDRPGIDEQRRPQEGTRGRKDDEGRDPHPGDTGREADERPDDRQQAANENRCRTVTGEEVIGKLDLVGTDQQVLSI